ncbi:hypothetical protein ACIQ7D_19880 [Streptomyces sp. NPDC096310]|uniref:hypothetical protein n=1 Tax=Streptomyces sp. NPDC096310 TaxID=3366082 RepID=UPI0037FAEDFB
MVDDDLPTRLREAAGEHRPDRERMLARVERGMAGPRAVGRPAQPLRPAGWPRVAVVTAAAAGALGVGALALVSTQGTPNQTVAASPEPARPSAEPAPGLSSPHAPVERSPSRSPEGHATAGTSRPAGPPETRTSPAAPDNPPAGSAAPSPTPESGFLRSEGVVDPHSNAYWAQSNITLRTERPLTSLTVELRVVATGGIEDAGSWRSLPEQDFTLSVRVRDGALVYRWTLRDGATVPAGEHVFAGQYNHDEGGRNAEDDRYTARAVSSGETAEVTGDFAPGG